MCSAEQLSKTAVIYSVSKLSRHVSIKKGTQDVVLLSSDSN